MSGADSPLSSPVRFQLSRRKGWRKPDGALVVSRPSRWGNPFTIASAEDVGFIGHDWSDFDKRAFVVDCFRNWLHYGPDSSWWFEAGRQRWEWMHEHLPDLRGHDLGCWCPLDHRCHADVLLEAANVAQ